MTTFLAPQIKEPTTDALTLLAKVRQIVSNDLDCLLAKTSRSAPLETDEVKRLKILSEILESTLKSEIEQNKADEPTAIIHNNLIMASTSTEDLKRLLKAGSSE